MIPTMTLLHPTRRQSAIVQDAGPFSMCLSSRGDGTWDASCCRGWGGQPAAKLRFAGRSSQGAEVPTFGDPRSPTPSYPPVRWPREGRGWCCY